MLLLALCSNCAPLQSLCTPNNAHHYFFAQVCQGIRCALVGGIIVPSMVSPAQPPPFSNSSCSKPLPAWPRPFCSTPAQALPKPRPAQSHTLLNHANHLLKPCPPALPKPCPKPALLKQALLKPRPAQTTTCSTIPAPRPHPAQTTPRPSPAQTSSLLKAIPCSTTPIPCSI